MRIEKHYDKINSLFLTRENIFNFFFGAVIFLSDRISKIKIIDHQLENNRIYINDFVNFDLVWNTGIGFGIFSSTNNLVYHSITGVIGIVLIFIVYLISKSKFIDKVFFTMILGGALGNFYDRIVYSAVPDFIDIHYQSFHWFTFNIADISISIGVIMLIFKDVFFKNEKNK
jgi:signal peptidase II